MSKGILKRIGLIALSGVLVFTTPVTAFADETTENSGGTSSGGNSGGSSGGGGSSSSSTSNNPSSGSSGSSSSSSSSDSSSGSSENGSSSSSNESSSSTGSENNNSRSVVFSPTSVRLNVGDKTTINVTQNDNITDLVITWSSDDTSVATVTDSGEVTAVAVGNTRIRASYTYNSNSGGSSGSGTANLSVIVKEKSSTGGSGSSGGGGSSSGSSSGGGGSSKKVGGGTPTGKTKTATKEEQAAEEKIWELINKYADPDYYLVYGQDYYDEKVTEAQFNEIKKTAESVVAGKSGDYEKIKALTTYIAENVYYDYDYYQKRTSSTNLSSYDVFTNKTTVCDGYSRLMKTMCNLVGIPCMRVYGTNHAFNAAYASDRKKWICLDATWCSGNKYNYNGSGGMSAGKLNMTRFDMSPSYLAGLTNHETYGTSKHDIIHGFADGTSNSLYYSLVNVGTNISEWKFVISGSKSKEPIFQNEIGGMPVECSVAGRINSQYQTYELIEDSTFICDKLDLSNANINKIPDSMFMFKEGIHFKSIVLPQSVTVIGKNAFPGCGLEELDLSDTNVEEIGNGAFASNSLKVVKLPQSLKVLSNSAFRECGISEIDLSKTQLNSVNLETLLFNESNVKKIYLPEKLKTLNIDEFYSKKKVTIVVNGNSLKTVKPAYEKKLNATIKIKAKNKKTYNKTVKKFKKAIKSKKVKYQFVKG